jgi:hypothetical protein
MARQPGNENFFLNYYLYLPFSQKQEEDNIKEILSLLNEMGVVKFKNKEDLNLFLDSVCKLFSDISDFDKAEVKEIKKELRRRNKKQGLINDNLSYFNEDNSVLSKIIYGDYIYKSENVEVFLHQRTMKKVRYKKRPFSVLHPINSDLIENIKLDADELINNFGKVSHLTQESMTKEFNTLRSYY